MGEELLGYHNNNRSSRQLVNTEVLLYFRSAVFLFLLSDWLLNAEDADIVEYTRGKITLPVQEKTSLVDEKALDQLLEMGFDRRKATKALLVNR